MANLHLSTSIHQNFRHKSSGYGHLQKWAAPKNVVVLSFFFYRPASNALKTFNGLWMSLCYQLLSADSSLLALASKDPTTPDALARRLRGDFSDRLWMTQELKQVASYLFHKSTSRSSYCLLLDGLDEFSDNQHELIRTLQQLTDQNATIKIYCSSRPEDPFENGFKTCSFLKLQDHTAEDMAD